MTIKTISQIEDEVIAEQPENVKRMLREWVEADGGDIEKTVRWASRNMSFGGRRFWRENIRKALAS